MFIAALIGLTAVQGSVPLDLPKGFDANPYIQQQTRGKFVENKGQWKGDVKFLAHTGGLDTWVTKTGFAYGWKSKTKSPELPLIGKVRDDVRSSNVYVDFVGSNQNAKTQGIHSLPGIYGYVSNTTSGPRTIRSKSYSSTVTHDLYPGIDLVNYFEPETGEPRYDLIVHPGANPDQIRMRYRGAKDLKVDENGQLKYSVGEVAKVSEQQKVAFQSGDLAQNGGAGADYHFMPRQVLESDGSVGFDVRGYKKDRTLVIDPLVYSTYLGAGEGQDFMNFVSVDAAGDSLVGGEVLSSQFTGGASLQSLGYTAKFAPDQTLISQTVFNYSGSYITAGAIGASGTNYLCLMTDGAVGGNNGVNNTEGHTTTLFMQTLDNVGVLSQDVLNPDGIAESLQARMTVNPSTSLATVAVLVGGNAYVYQISSTNTVSGPTNAYADNTSQYVLGLGGVAVGASGDIYIAVSSSEKSLPGFSGAYSNSPNFGLNRSNPAAVVVKTRMGNPSPDQETFLGGVGSQQALALALDSSGNPVVFGNILASSMPSTQGGVNVTTTFSTTANAYEQGPVGANDCGFICKLNPALTTVLAATLFQSTSDTSISNGTLASDDSPVFTGDVDGTLPLTWDYFDGRFEAEYLAKLSSDLSTLEYATFVGAFDPSDGSQVTNNAIAIDSSGKYYICGQSDDANLPLTPNAIMGFTPDYSGVFTIIDPSVTPGLNSITSDRGAAPALAGGSGRTFDVNVHLVEPTGTPITLVADQTGIVTINGTADQGTTVVSGYDHIVSFFVMANDVATDTVVNLSVSMDGRTVSIPLTVHPFLRQVILRAATVASGTSTTAYVYPYEVPVTDHVVTLTSSPSAFSSTSVSIRGLASGENITGPTTKVLSIGQFAVDTAVTVTAANQSGVSSVSSALTVQGIDIASMTCTPATVTSGSPTTLQVTLKATYPVDVTLNIASSDPAHAANATVTILAGSLTGSTSIATSGVTGTKNVSVRFSDVAVSPKVSAGLTITPSH